MHEEYRAITDAGLNLQIDDPTMASTNQTMTWYRLWMQSARKSAFWREGLQRTTLRSCSFGSSRHADRQRPLSACVTDFSHLCRTTSGPLRGYAQLAQLENVEQLF